MPLDQISLESDLVDRVYERLLTSISDGELPAGTRLGQEELASRLNVSRQPVLQALRLLKKDGFVVDAGRRGVMVTPLDADFIERVYQLRAVLDALAAGLAARCEAQLDERLIDAGRRATKRDVSAMIEADIAFHNAIYLASGNPLIAESANRHWGHIRRAMGAVLQNSDARAGIWDEHAAILDAIRAGDSALAEQLSRAHGEAAGRNLAAQLVTRSSVTLSNDRLPKAVMIST
jgi:DNA-binding GntR family transcriptional regulator